jgi:hypothetical protein
MKIQTIEKKFGVKVDRVSAPKSPTRRLSVTYIAMKDGAVICEKHTKSELYWALKTGTN